MVRLRLLYAPFLMINPTAGLSIAAVEGGSIEALK